MFNKESVSKAVKIQKLGYSFLIYIADKIDKNKFTFSRIHENEKSTDVLFKWVNDYYDYLPQKILPDKSEIQIFCNYFASYLTTSFELTEEPERRNNLTGCYCNLCLQMVNLSHLKPISPNNYDRELADQKRLEILKEYGNHLGIILSDEAYKTIANDQNYKIDTAYLAYTKALFQRMQSSVGGVYILALWRKFAWFEGKPIKNFELETNSIMNSMKRVEIELLNRRGSSKLFGK